ncbi:MAG: hypothetical protein KDJ80_04435 [Nitratireductor sp.]|nr:hypothetical protein [Nitratireductor sp.]
MTLVVTPEAPETTVLWKALALDDLDEAIAALAEREDIREANIPYSVGYWSAGRTSDHREVSVIEAWATGRGLDAVIWTALKPRFMGESGRIPDIGQVIDSLDGLEGETRAIAERYVRRAPVQITTPYRAVIEERLGWTPHAGDQ